MMTAVAEMAEEIRNPKNKAEALAALSMKRPRGAHRKVFVHHFKTRSTDYRRAVLPVSVHPSNRLRLMLMSGIATIRVESGHVEIFPKSVWGNVIEVCEGASATVLVEPNYKVTIDNAGTLEVVTTQQNRVYVSAGAGKTTWTYREEEEVRNAGWA